MLACLSLLAAFLARRLGVRWGLFWVGAVTFIASQVVHIPLNILLGRLGQIRSPPPISGWPLIGLADRAGPVGRAVRGVGPLPGAALLAEARPLVALGADVWRRARRHGGRHPGRPGRACRRTQHLRPAQRRPRPLGVHTRPDARPFRRQLAAACRACPGSYPLLGAVERVFAPCYPFSSGGAGAAGLYPAATSCGCWPPLAGTHSTDGVAVYVVPAWGPLLDRGGAGRLGRDRPGAMSRPAPA